MATTWNINDLEVIGYAGSRGPDMLPAVVPPVFQLKSDPHSVLVPPFSLLGDTVVDAVRISRREAETLSDDEELTLLPLGPMPARPGWELWLRRDGKLMYQPVEEAHRTLDRLCDEAIQRAVHALSNPDSLDQAEAAASEAALCNDHRADPFIIKSAIRRLRKNHLAAQRMLDIAETLTYPGAAQALQDYYCGIASNAESPLRQQSGRHVMDNIAAIAA